MSNLCYSSKTSPRLSLILSSSVSYNKLYALNSINYISTLICTVA